MYNAYIKSDKSLHTVLATCAIKNAIAYLLDDKEVYREDDLLVFTDDNPFGTPSYEELEEARKPAEAPAGPSVEDLYY